MALDQCLSRWSSRLVLVCVPRRRAQLVVGADCLGGIVGVRPATSWTGCSISSSSTSLISKRSGRTCSTCRLVHHHRCCDSDPGLATEREDTVSLTHFVPDEIEVGTRIDVRWRAAPGFAYACFGRDQSRKPSRQCVAGKPSHVLEPDDDVAYDIAAPLQADGRAARYSVDHRLRGRRDRGGRQTGRPGHAPLPRCGRQHAGRRAARPCRNVAGRRCRGLVHRLDRVPRPARCARRKRRWDARPRDAAAVHRARIPRHRRRRADRTNRDDSRTAWTRSAQPAQVRGAGRGKPAVTHYALREAFADAAERSLRSRPGARTRFAYTSPRWDFQSSTIRCTAGSIRAAICRAKPCTHGGWPSNTR